MTRAVCKHFSSHLIYPGPRSVIKPYNCRKFTTRIVCCPEHCRGYVADINAEPAPPTLFDEGEHSTADAITALREAFVGAE